MKSMRVLILIGFSVICAWQGLFFLRSTPVTDEYRDVGTTGLYFHNFRRFFYFYHHLGLFPVAATIEPTVDTREGAEAFIQANGPSLVNELAHTIRSGERGKVMLFQFDAWMRGTTLKAGTRPFHALAFILALVALWIAFVFIGEPVLGALTILFLGSNPFQLWEVYRSSNLFGWPGTVGIFLLAISLPLIYRKAGPRYGYAYLAVAAIILGTIRVIRPEPAALVLSAGGVYWFFTAADWRRKTAAIGAFIALFLGTTWTWNAYFDAKTEQAIKFVTENGGYPYPSFRYAAHRFWHPMYLGFSDFDQKYGHVWDDLQGYQLAYEILSESSSDYPYRVGMYMMDKSHDAKGRYAIKWEDLPEYNALMKRVYFQRVMGDPAWFVTILFKRVVRILTETTPLTVHLSKFRVSMPWPGWIWLGLVFVAFLRRRRRDLALLLFMTPICATTFLVYSGDGRSYYSIYHLFAAPLLLAWLGETNYVRDIWRKFHAWNPAR